MAKLILQPAGNKDGREHYVDTIQNMVDTSIIKAFQPNLASEIDRLYPNGKAPVWGVTPGKNNVNKNKWDRIGRGDVTVFSKSGGIFATAVTTLKFHDKKLAEKLWNQDASGNTWEYIYLLDEVRLIDIPYLEFNKRIGYNPNFIIQGFNVIDDNNSALFLSGMGLFSDKHTDQVTIIDYTDAITKLENETTLDSKQTQSYGRKEQSFLRESLFKSLSQCKCSICGKEYPIDMLITAHIKKRSQCSKAEKLDYKNIVTPMCVLGCDSAYEKGYIYVDDQGIIRVNDKKSLTPDLETYFKIFKDSKCLTFNTGNQKYFEVHRKELGK